MDESLTKIRHDRSVKDFPHLQLEDDEYVEFFFKRAKICLQMIWWGTFGGLVVILLSFLLVLLGQTMLDDMGVNFLYIILFTLLAATFLLLAVSLKVHHGNKIYITNKRVIQLVMVSPVLTSINIIDLVSVEDASFRQDSFIQKLFKFGTFRLSTVGDETTYTFKFSDITPEELRAVINLITSAKEKMMKGVIGAADKK